MSRSIRSNCPPSTVLLHRKFYRLAIALVVAVLSLLVVIATPAYAQDATIPSALESGVTTAALPSLWYLLAAGLAMLVPAGFVLLASANLKQEHAWNAALGGLAAAGLALFAYWAIGYALQFGGVGLVYPHAGLRGQVWEWSPLSSEWGIGWGMAGLTGWFLSGDLSALSMSLFLGHAPWVMVAALLPVMTLRGRAPALVTLLLALVMGGLVYPLAGNWVQGGGWLNALGRNMELGHGFVDYGGAGSVHLVTAGFALAALTVWSTRRNHEPVRDAELPPAHQPLLAVVGALLILGGSIGWMFANPLQVETVGEFGMMRGAVAFLLAAAGGIVFPLFYTWFVTGRSEPTLTARGFAAGVVAGLACGPFVAPGIAFVVGLAAGATVPFVTFLLDGRLRVDDRTGVVISSGVPAIIGLLLVGVFADGRAGAGWQMTGAGAYLGVNGQGVSGLLVASGFQMDFPAQLQAQVIGVVALGLWGFLTGLVVCVPLGLLFHSLLRRNDRPAVDRTVRQVASPVVGASMVGTSMVGAPVSLPADPRLPSAETRHPTTTSTYAVPMPAYLDAPARNITPPSMPGMATPQPTGSQTPIPTESASVPSTTLPGYAPGERRAPLAANYLAPAVTSPAQTAPIEVSSVPDYSTIPNAPIPNAPVPAAFDTGFSTLKSTEPTVAPDAPAADTSWITAPVRGEEDSLPYSSELAKTPREGYWPAQTEQFSSGAEHRNPLPEYGVPSTSDAPVPGATNGEERKGVQPNGAPQNGTLQNGTQQNGAPRNGNPLMRNGTRQRPAAPPDEPSA